MTDELLKHWRLMFENKWVGAWDLMDKAKAKYVDKTVTIESVTWESVQTEYGKQRKLVLRFARATIPLILSKPNGKTLEQMFGEDPHGWVGKSITLYAKKKRVQSGVSMVVTIRGSGRANAFRQELEREPEEDDTPDPPAVAPAAFGDEEEEGK